MENEIALHLPRVELVPPDLTPWRPGNAGVEGVHVFDAAAAVRPGSPPARRELYRIRAFPCADQALYRGGAGLNRSCCRLFIQGSYQSYGNLC